MLICLVRTTLNIDDDLYRQVKATAALRGCSVTSLVEESLRQALAAGAAQGPSAPMPVSSRVGGLTTEFLNTGIDIDDTSAVLDWLDEPAQ